MVEEKNYKNEVQGSNPDKKKIKVKNIQLTLNEPEPSGGYCTCKGA